MTFDEVLDQVRELLQSKGRVTYRALKRRFDLDDEYLEDIKGELIKAEGVAAEEDGDVLVWTGASPVSSSRFQVPSPTQSPIPSPQSPAERRQLTVMFCDLVGSTALSTQLDPEDLRAVVQQYQRTCAEVIQRHEGYIAQYLGDGLLVYFGYPTAHEDDARRAVRTGLEILEAIRTRGFKPLVSLPLQVRIGIHTGLVVIGDIGAMGRTEQLALGETPNIAARIQGLAEPNTVLISAATQRLVDGQFECQPFGSHLVKGIDTPLAVYHVQSERQSAALFVGRTTLTPLVGREQEVGLLFDRWEQVKEGRGQVVLLSGEPGIGKSRLAYTLREQVTSEGSLLFEARCSSYHQHSALYPLIEVLQRTLLLTRQDTDEEKVAKLASALALYDMQASLSLFTALLSLPTPSHYPPLNFTPQKQKDRTLQALVQLLAAQAERQATVLVWEDLHWADPSSLEFLSLLIDQLPTSKLLLVLTFRPEFTPPWKPRSHLSQLVLNRLGKKQVEAMIEQAAAGKYLPPDVIEQIRLKTDGVPLFVEELTKSVVESRRGQGAEDGGQDGNTVGTVGIPATLQEALLARLDRLSEARSIAQLGATLGREFSHELLQAVAPVNELDLQTALAKLVEAEILYQRGVGEQSRYFFKHALIQDTAYQSLLKSTRQQYHQQIAHVLEDRFPDAKEHQPELLAHHYTEANLIEQAVPYWSEAGQKASQRLANAEAISHLTKGLELLKALPDSSDRAHQEISLLLALGAPLISSKGPGVPEVGAVYGRALALCRQVGETPQLFPVLAGLRVVYTIRGELQTARELAEQLLRLAERVQDLALLVEAHAALGSLLELLGEPTTARRHLERVTILHDPQQQRSSIHRHGLDVGTPALSMLAQVLWILGYPQQAKARSREALTRAQETKLPFGTAMAWNLTAELHQFLREAQAVLQQTAVLCEFCHEQEISLYFAMATLQHGWSLVMLEKEQEGFQEIQQGFAAVRATGREIRRTYHLALLAEAYGKTGQVEEGIAALVEALEAVNQMGERWFEAELYRLKGELTLQLQVESRKSQVEKEAEEYFLKAIDIARQQQAKSWELRAAMSLSRLWQQQGKKAEARQMLAEIYNWFTEGFDTKDLQEAKGLLESL